jgi:hypothetical protein
MRWVIPFTLVCMLVEVYLAVVGAQNMLTRALGF